MVKLIRYDKACRALAEAKAVDEVKEIRDKAVAMTAYAKQAKNRELEADAAEIRERATRRLDQLRQAQKDTVGLNTGAKGIGTAKVRVDGKPTLASQGIDKNLAHHARVLGKMSEERFEEHVGEVRRAVTRATKRVVRNAAIEQDRRETYRPGGSSIYDDIGELIRRGEKFAVIYADPPWSFDVYSGKGKERSAERHYDTMTLDEIRSLAVGRLAAEDCVLMLWAVWPELPGALDVIEAWGFEYKTCGLIYLKTNPRAGGLATGMGYWSRANTEPCLLATRGSPQRLAADVKQVIEAPRGDHSEKPEEAARRIERLLPGPYLELFSRRERPGWTVCGNEILTSGRVGSTLVSA